MVPLSAPRRTLAALALGIAFTGGAQAGLFDDAEARQAITDLRASVNERIETQARAQLELAGQIEALRAENAKLRGLVETLTHEIETAKKRQQDFYVDLDARVRKLETAAAAAATAAAATPPAGETAAPSAPRRDPAAEARAYEAALNLFKAARYKDAAAAFEAFAKDYGDSDLAPSAQYWLGNSLYAQHDCKRAIDAQSVIGIRWPNHAKAPDALLNIATCQQDLGDAKAARKTLETLVARYPGTQAGETASKRLKKK